MSEKEELESELGSYLVEIGNAEEGEARTLVEERLNPRINIIVNRLAEIEQNG